MRRNKRLAGAALAAALAAACACGRPSEAPAPEAPGPAGGVTLAAPAPSSTVVTSPLGAGAADYTNEMQVQNLRVQAAALGISRLSRPSVAGIESDEPRRTITYQEGIERTRELSREVEAQRHAIEGDRNRSVAIPTETPGMIPGGKGGAPIENAPADPGPKDLPPVGP